MADKKTAIVTGASRGIGAGLVEAFLNEGYNVVATSRHVSAGQAWTASRRFSVGRALMDFPAFSWASRNS